MSEQTKNIIWMNEPIAFDIQPTLQTQAADVVQHILESAAGHNLKHWPYHTS